MSKNVLSRIAGDAGSELYSGAGTYKTSDGSLKKDTVAIYVREDQAAMITSAKAVNNNGTTYDLAGNLIAGNLKAGDFFTFPHPISEIVIAGGSFIGYQA
jgi:hypothetical protein